MFRGATSLSSDGVGEITRSVSRCDLLRHDINSRAEDENDVSLFSLNYTSRNGEAMVTVMLSVSMVD